MWPALLIYLQPWHNPFAPADDPQTPRGNGRTGGSSWAETVVLEEVQSSDKGSERNYGTEKVCNCASIVFKTVFEYNVTNNTHNDG